MSSCVHTQSIRINYILCVELLQMGILSLKFRYCLYVVTLPTSLLLAIRSEFLTTSVCSVFATAYT